MALSVSQFSNTFVCIASFFDRESSMSYLLNFRRKCLFRATCDLTNKLIQLPLAKHAIAFTFELKGRRAWNDRLTHGTWSTIGRAAHGWPCLAHMDRLRRTDVEMTRDRHLGIVQLLPLTTAKITLSAWLHGGVCALWVGVRSVCCTHCSLV